MQLKMFVLSGAAVALWLAPLTVLDKKVGWHKSAQGLSLMAAVACAVTAGNIARELSEQGEIEAIKTRAITADVVDEIATSAYVSQAQRQQEAEAILNSVEHLERALALPDAEVERSEPIAQNQLAEPEKNGSENGESERTERIHQLQAKGWGKAKIILEIWGVTKGGSPKYKAAEAEYKRLVEDSV
jgi:flagellar motility protein MotE (MotC chaperone)